jgi:hypothetical protein
MSPCRQLNSNKPFALTWLNSIVIPLARCNNIATEKKGLEMVEGDAQRSTGKQGAA